MPRPKAPDREHHKLAIAAAVHELEQSLRLFIDALTHDKGPSDLGGTSTEMESLRRICEAYAAVRYEPDQEANTSPTCLGVIGASAPVIARAHAVNESKGRLKEACAPIYNARVRVPVKDGKGGRVVRLLPLVHVILRELQRSDLNLLAAYRKIPILTGRPTRVAYVRARTRAVYRKDRAAIAALLAGIDRPGVEEDRARLSSLPARENHLALVKEHYANVRANVTFHGLDSRNRGRVLVTAELPLLYPQGRSKELPEIAYPPPEGEEGSATPSRRRTGKLENEPFLKTLPVYRYRTKRRPGRGD